MAKGTTKAAPAPRLTVQEKKWRAQEDLSTLQRASAIASDKSRIAAAQAEAKAQMDALAKVAKTKK